MSDIANNTLAAYLSGYPDWLLLYSLNAEESQAVAKLAIQLLLASLKVVQAAKAYVMSDPPRPEWNILIDELIAFDKRTS